MIVVIRLTPEERAECATYDARVSERIRRYRPSYTGLETGGRYGLGHAGHIAVRRWAKSLGLKFTEAINADGLSDSEDFIFPLTDGRECAANVKTRGSRGKGRPEPDVMMQPVAQHERMKQDIYIAASDDGVDVKLWGFIPCKEFEKSGRLIQRRVPTLELPFASLPYTMASLGGWIEKDGKQSERALLRGQDVSVQRR